MIAHDFISDVSNFQVYLTKIKRVINFYVDPLLHGRLWAKQVGPFNVKGSVSSKPVNEY
jgi:hypothetical protein